MMRISWKSFLLLCAFLGARAGAAGAPPASVAVPLRSIAPVRGEQVRLSDLVPDGVSESLRRLASTIVIGNAPQPGLRRTIAGEFIARQLNSIPELSSAFQIPAEVVVVREYRQLSQEEIFPAIQDALEKSGCAELLSLKAGNVELPAPILIREADASAKVTGMELDSLRGEFRFRLRLSGDPLRAPFYALVRAPAAVSRAARQRLKPIPRDPGEGVDEENAPEDLVCHSFDLSREHLFSPSGLAAKRELPESPKPIKLEGRTTQVRPRPPVLVRSGQSATLLAGGPGMRISLTVIPLQPGAQGEEIHVRILATDQVLTATVVAPNLLQLTF